MRGDPWSTAAGGRASRPIDRSAVLTGAGAAAVLLRAALDRPSQSTAAPRVTLGKGAE